MKRSRVEVYLLGLLAGGLLAGCTAGPVEEIVPEESRPVALSFGKPDLGVPELLTRGGEAVSPAPTPLPPGTTVRIGAYFTGDVGGELQEAGFATTEPSFEATYVVGDDGGLSPCLVDADGKQVDGEAGGMTVRGGVYDFYAVSPARKLVEEGGNYTITSIPHKEDVMISFARGVTVSRASREVVLETFRRQCALLVFNVAPAKENALPFEQLSGTRLQLSNISTSGASLIAGSETGIPPTGGGIGAETVVTFEENEFVPVETSSDPGAMGLNKTTGIVLPKNNRPFKVEIDVKRNNETATLKATVDKEIAFDAGKRYIFTLIVKNNECRLDMKVLAWNIILFTDENVGAPPGGSYPDPDINQGIGISFTVAKWTEIAWSDMNVGGDN